MQGKWKGLGLVVVVAVAFLFALSGLASASGSGYNQSFTRTAGATDPNVQLTSLTSTYSSGPNLTVSLSVAGSIDLVSNTTGYDVFFGGGGLTNSTTYVGFTNNTTVGFYYTSVGGSSFGTLPVTVSGGTLSFSIQTAVVGAASAFTINAWAWTGSTTSGTYSFLGTNYNGASGGSCTNGVCTTSTAASPLNWWIIIIPVIVVIVIIVVVVVLVMRKKPAQPAMMGQPGQPMGQPGWNNPPPPSPGQPTWQSPPPPPPPGTQ